MLGYLTTLLFCSVTTTIIAAVYKLLTPKLMVLFRAKWCYYAWVIILIGLVIPFRPQFESTIISLPLIAESYQLVDLPIHTNSSESQLQETDADLAPSQTNILPSADIQISETSISTYAIIAAIWFLGALLYFSKHIVRHIRFVRSLARWSKDVADEFTLNMLHDAKNELGIRTDINILYCESIDIPLLVGFLKPRILLPVYDYSTFELHIILKHELTHYRHGDLWIKLLSVLAVSMHWFNPILRYLLKEISVICEIACDDDITKNASLSERKQYCMAILNSERRIKHPTMFSTAFSISPSKLQRRVTTVMNMKKRWTGAILVFAVFVLLASSGMAFSIQGEAVEIDYIGNAFIKEQIIDGEMKGDDSTDYYITGISSVSYSESNANSDIYSEEAIGSSVIDMRYRYSFNISQKDLYKKTYNTQVFFDYDFSLSDYISYEELNQLIGSYLTSFEDIFKTASFDEITQDDGLVQLMKACQEYVKEHTDSRVIFRYSLSGMVGNAPISIPYEKIDREINAAN